jgi:CheY-like chemotaxis protein
VRDTGQGINPEISDRIFEPFFTTKKRGEGSGMGLAVVHGIVKGHGGTIDVSSAPGQGSTFNIFFPRVQADVVPEPSPSILQPGKNERVLLVDDDQPILRSLQSALERLGYRVTATPDSREAWEIFRSQPDAIDLVITDQIMPQMTGMQLAEKLLGLRGDIPIILITGFSEDIGEDAAKALGIREFLLKPSNAQALSEAVRRVLDQKG